MNICAFNRPLTARIRSSFSDASHRFPLCGHLLDGFLQCLMIAFIHQPFVMHGGFDLCRDDLKLIQHKRIRPSSTFDMASSPARIEEYL